MCSTAAPSSRELPQLGGSESTPPRKWLSSAHALALDDDSSASSAPGIPPGVTLICSKLPNLGCNAGSGAR